MTYQEFKEQIGDKQLVVMKCKIEGSAHRGKRFKEGQIFGPVTIELAYTLWKQDNGERWEVTGMTMTPQEQKALNEHFEKTAALESGKPKKIKTIK